MASRDLLPGVTADSCPPVISVQSQREIVRARRRAILRDAAHLLLLGGVDYLFVSFPLTHVPSFDRYDSALIVLFMNAAVIGHVTLSRILPRLRAKRIATTWSLSERARFFAQQRGEQPTK